MMRKLKGRRIRHICSIPHCSNTVTMVMTRADEFGAAAKVYLCTDCAKEAAELYGYGVYDVDTAARLGNVTDEQEAIQAAIILSAQDTTSRQQNDTARLAEIADINDVPNIQSVKTALFELPEADKRDIYDTLDKVYGSKQTASYAKKTK